MGLFVWYNFLMKITEFEEKIQKEVDPDLSVRVNPNAPDIAGIYYKEAYCSVAVPPDEIREEPDKNYMDKMGHQYRTIDQAINLLKAKLESVKDPDNYKLLTEKHD